jgi:predicted RNase H-like HicB family nuclease
MRRLTAIIEREGNGYVSLCPELDIASQGASIDEARANLQEAMELFFETASKEEIETRLHDEVYITHVEVAYKYASAFFWQGCLSNLSAAWLQ